MPDLKTRDFSIAFFDRHLAEILDIVGDVPGGYGAAENFRRELPEKRSLSLVLVDDTLPVGYAIASRKASDQVHLHH